MVRISVILCSYNGETTLEAALNSALIQSMDPAEYEVILVDDGSTDGTSAIASSYLTRYPNFRYQRDAVNRGLVSACNRGLKMARGRYVIRLDDDDIFDREILGRLVQPLDEDQTDLVYCDRYEVLTSTGEKKYVSLANSNLFELTAAGVMMRRDLLTELKGYRDLFWEEYDLYIRYAQRSRRPFFHIPQPLYRYNRRPGSLTMTRSGENVRLGWQELKSAWGEETLRRFGWDPATVEH